MLATSRGDYTTEAAAIGVEYYTDVDDFCEEHPEIVLLASSILSLEAVIRSLPVQRLKRSTLFVDVLSVKEFPKRLLLSTLPPEVTRAPRLESLGTVCPLLSPSRLVSSLVPQHVWPTGGSSHAGPIP